MQIRDGLLPWNRDFLENRRGPRLGEARSNSAKRLGSFQRTFCFIRSRNFSSSIPGATAWTAAIMLACVISSVSGCGAETVQQEEPKLPKTGVAAGAELSKCVYKDRNDRTFAITRGPGSRHANVLRVFEVAVDKKQARRVLRCRQVDTNLDGIRDVIRTYNDDGEPALEQADTDYDGRIDTWVRFSRGKVLRTELDRNRDGKPDEFRVYTGGKLSRIQRDTDFNGRLDTWEVYDGERLHRVGVDVDGDERVDRWYRGSQPAPSASDEAKPTDEERERARNRAPVEIPEDGAESEAQQDEGEAAEKESGEQDAAEAP